MLLLFNFFTSKSVIAGIIIYLIYSEYEEYVEEITPEEFIDFIKRGEAQRIIFQ